MHDDNPEPNTDARGFLEELGISEKEFVEELSRDAAELFFDGGRCPAPHELLHPEDLSEAEFDLLQRHLESCERCASIALSVSVDIEEASRVVALAAELADEFPERSKLESHPAELEPAIEAATEQGALPRKSPPDKRLAKKARRSFFDAAAAVGGVALAASLIGLTIPTVQSLSPGSRAFVVALLSYDAPQALPWTSDRDEAARLDGGDGLNGPVDGSVNVRIPDDGSRRGRMTISARDTTRGGGDPGMILSRHSYWTSYDNNSVGIGEHVARIETALASREGELGEDHPDTLRAMTALAIAYDSAGRHDEAIALLERTFATQQAQLGEGHADTLRSMIALSIAYHGVGRGDEAAALMVKALTTQEVATE